MALVLISGSPRVSRVPVALLSVFAVAACAGSGVPVGGGLPATWDAHVRRVLEEKPSALERAILSDGVVTDEEYGDAQLEFLDCAAARGLPTKLLDGQYVTEPAETAADLEPGEVEEALRNCNTGTLKNVEAIYHGMRDNPDYLSFAEGVRECLDLHGLADAEHLSDAEVDTLAERADYVPSEPQALACVVDPFGSSSSSSHELYATWLDARGEGATTMP